MLERFFPISESWSYSTFFLYISVTFIVTDLCKKGAIYRSKILSNKCDTIRKTKILKYYYIFYFFAYIILVALATLRSPKVGSDTLVYVGYFKSRITFKFSLESLLSFNQMEPGFQLYLMFIQNITDDYHIFFFVAYACIAASYIFFILEFFDEKSDYIFLQIFIFFYVSNMSGMRSAMGMIFLLPAFIELSKKKYIKSIILTFLAALFHYTMIFNIINIFMVILLSSPIFRVKRWVIPTSLIISIFISYWMLGKLNKFIEFTKYGYYTVSTEELSLLGSSFLIIFVILIFYNHKIIIDYLNKNSKYENIYTCVIAFIITYPSIYLTAAYRLTNYYVMPRLIIWSIIERAYEKRINKNSIIVFRVLIQIVVILYLFFRFTRSARDGAFTYII